MSVFLCASRSWHPTLGDPHFMGWVTVGVYILAAASALLVAWRGRFPAETARRERIFWTLAAVLLLFLAVNKQLDLQSALTAAARCLAQAQGWYQDRRVVQIAFIIGLLVAGVMGLIFLAWLLRGTMRRTGLALLGLCVVTVFVLVRAAGFHHMDILINETVGGVRLNWVLELPGPLIVLLTAMRELMPSRSQ